MLWWLLGTINLEVVLMVVMTLLSRELVRVFSFISIIIPWWWDVFM